MKKFIVSLGITCLIAMTCIFMTTASYHPNVSPSKPVEQKPASTNEDYIDDLKYAGFTSVKVVEEQRNKERQIKAEKEASIYLEIENYWWKKGIKFYSDMEMQDIIEKNNFRVGLSAEYVGEVPKEMATLITNNLKIVLDASRPVYYKEYSWNWVSSSPASHIDRLVHVVAPAGMFSTGGSLGKDPIVCVKVDGGWVVLAEWL